MDRAVGGRYDRAMGNSYTYRQDSAGRVQPTDTRYLAHPGTCLLCARPPVQEGEVFANLGVELEYFGVAYLCFDCCAEVADFIQFKSPEKYEQIFDANMELIHALDEARADLERAKGLLHARIDSFVSGEPVSDGASGIPVPETKPVSTSLYQTLNSSKSEPSKSGQK